MSEPPHPVDVAAWVARAAQDPVAHRQRQAVEIILHAIAMTGPLNTGLFLKGGILLGLAYGSPRQTTDIDLTAAFAADGDIDARIGKLLNFAFPRTAANLGYADLVLRTQSVKGHPHHIFP
ncbi:MAG: nucleotidyl transferase AbiEii/AbiGii toxin family protein [Alphaproteobacteria bacterium]|nr:nucleotidyl transferase AbiEii/AbiGii toxin family protein [Alphaproteobacteria bacterium]